MSAAPTTDENLNQIFSGIRVRLAAVAQYRIGDDKVREDVVQESLLVLVEKYPALPSPGGALAYALQVLRNKIGDYYRQQQRVHRTFVEIDAVDNRDPTGQRRKDPVGGTPRPDELLEKDEIHQRVRTAIGQLGVDCQKILLGLLEDKSRAELASQLNKSMEAFYKQLSRCMQHMRQLLKANA